MSCEVGEVMERFGEWAELIVIVIAELILQPFRHFIYVTTHSPTLPSLYLRHNSFSNSSVASPTLQFILQPFFRFSYGTGSSLTSPGEPPMEKWVVNYKDEDKIGGHSTVEQATTVSFTEMEEGSTNAVNIIIERERERESKHIFCLSRKFCLIVPHRLYC